MSETLRQKQSRFARYVPLLLQYASHLGYEYTFGQVLRSDEQAEINALGATGRAQLVDFIGERWALLAEKISNNAGSGIRNTVHEKALALDLNLFKDGRYITDGEGHSKLGQFWKSLAPDCCWGGDFANKDFNHYSIQHEGRR